MLTYEKAVEILQTNVAFNTDLSKLLAEAMSCNFSDDELLKFWDFLVEEVHRRDDEALRSGRARMRLHGSWLSTLVGQLSPETVEYLADVPNPLNWDLYPDFEVGDLVQPSKKNEYDSEDLSEEEWKEKVLERPKGWSLIRGIWLQGFRNIIDDYIDLDEENKWNFHYSDETEVMKEAHRRLGQGMSWHTKDYDHWSRTTLRKLENEWYKSSVDRLDERGNVVLVNSQKISLKEYKKWEAEITPNQLRRHPIGMVMEKRFIPHSIHLKVSDTWFYQVAWVDYSDNIVLGWHARMAKRLVKADMGHILF